MFCYCSQSIGGSAGQWGRNSLVWILWIPTNAANITSMRPYSSFLACLVIFFGSAEHALPVRLKVSVIMSIICFSYLKSLDPAKSTSSAVISNKQPGPAYPCFPLLAWTHLVKVVSRSAENTHIHMHTWFCCFGLVIFKLNAVFICLTGRLESSGITSLLDRKCLAM